ncbi:hypothetical protein [Litorihabitans aurantiacus]|uniref:hypothetical protein n=1 Tax=Litorihabitans aurantiacus TaxID=1930061 RepID=UPI0024E09D92|nr:hypothetical protein [Litorihabitans aurantiacus]
MSGATGRADGGDRRAATSLAPTAAWTWTTAVAGAVAMLAVVVGRADVVALVTPVLVAAATGLVRRRASSIAPVELVREEDAPAGHHRARLRVPLGADARVRLSQPHRRPTHALLAAGTSTRVEVVTPRTGPLELVRLDWVATTGGLETVPRTRPRTASSSSRVPPRWATSRCRSTSSASRARTARVGGARVTTSATSRPSSRATGCGASTGA